MSRKRLKPADRRADIVAAAIRAAIRSHYMTITRADVAREAEVSMGLVTHYFGTMHQLRRAMMRAAVVGQVVPIVAQGLAQRDPQALKACPITRQAAASWLRGR